MASLHINDIDMHYSERGEGGAAIAAHAATSNSIEIGWLAQAISRHGLRVVTPDLRGHGQTANPAPDLHLPRLVDDMTGFMSQLGRSPVHGAGFSLGGAVMLYAAQRHPENFKSLVVLGTTYHATQERAEQALNTGPWDSHSEVVRRVFDRETGIIHGWDTPLEAFAVITCPTLIVMGDRDEFNGPEDGLALYRTLPDAELLVVPQADHIGLVRHPLVMEEIRAFYDRVAG